MIFTFVVMTVLFLYTLNDYLESRIVINVQPIVTGEKNVFPAVSVCIKKSNLNNDASIARVKSFVQKYYTEHAIDLPEE